MPSCSTFSSAIAARISRQTSTKSEIPPAIPAEAAGRYSQRIDVECAVGAVECRCTANGAAAIAARKSVHRCTGSECCERHSALPAICISADKQVSGIDDRRSIEIEHRSAAGCCAAIATFDPSSVAATAKAKAEIYR